MMRGKSDQVTLDEATVEAWTRLMRAQHAALAHIEERLKQADLPPLVWYDVLLELSRAPKEGLRPFEIERQMLLPQYGLSRLLNRIERAGYLRRVPCEEDGRGQLVLITPKGRELLDRMWPVYGEGLRDAIGGRLSVREASALCELLEKLH